MGAGWLVAHPSWSGAPMGPFQTKEDAQAWVSFHYPQGLKKA